MDLITLDDYKAFAGISSPNQDTLLTPIVNFVNQFVTNYLGYTTNYVVMLESENVIILPSSQTVVALGVEELVDGLLTNSVNITNFYQVGFKLFLPATLNGRAQLLY
jgi:hypothetical protein